VLLTGALVNCNKSTGAGHTLHNYSETPFVGYSISRAPAAAVVVVAVVPTTGC